MKCKNLFTGLLLFLSLFLYNCKEDQQIFRETKSPSDALSGDRTTAETNYSDNGMILGKKLTNPYSTKNMRIALQSLQSKV